MDVYGAIADPTRRKIIALLAAGERNAGDIARRFEMAGPSVSRHLKVLRDSGVISFRTDAQSRIYRLEARRLAEAEKWMRKQLDRLHAQFDALGAHLDEMAEREK